MASGLYVYTQYQTCDAYYFFIQLLLLLLRRPVQLLDRKKIRMGCKNEKKMCISRAHLLIVLIERTLVYTHGHPFGRRGKTGTHLSCKKNKMIL